MMGISFRPLAILIELIIIMGTIYGLFLGLRLVLFDLGLNPKYQTFIKLILNTVWILVLIFFTSHLILFYPNSIPPWTHGGREINFLNHSFWKSQEIF
jgi:hypothetical protein